MTSAFPVQNRFQMAPLLNLNDLKSKTAPLLNISVFDSHGSYCYFFVFAILHIMYVEICICAHGPYGLLHE